MYLLETYKQLKWLYKVTDDGLVNLKLFPLHTWTWDDITRFYSESETSHEWNVLLEEDVFLEQL